MLDSTRNNNFLRRSFGTACHSGVLTREEYMVVLRKERQQWKTLCKEKKKEVARKQPDVIIKREDVLTSLNEEDRAFRNGRPNYLLITQNAKDYVQSVIFFTKLAMQCKERYEKLVEDFAEKIDAVVDQLLLEENELCSICNNGFCTRELHPLVEQEKHSSSIISDMVYMQLGGKFKVFFLSLFCNL